MNLAPSALCAAAMLLALAGCSADTRNYPSLARRPVERSANAEPLAPPATLAPMPLSTDQIALIAASISRATTAHVRFGEAQSRVRQRVAAGSGAAPGSEAWAIASIALAELESARSAAMIALADLDQLYAATRIAGGDADSVASGRDQVMTMIREEDLVLAELRGKLGS